MREISLKEAQAEYGLLADESVPDQEPVLLRRNGEPVAAIVPIAEYEAFRAWREAEERRKRRQATQKAFERERAAYAQLEESLRPQYEGLYVAIRGGQVVDSDADELTLITRVYERFGHGPMYVRKVGAPLPVVRVPSPRLVDS
ncbi:MAG: type II toxin-antitoxin system Phd/YefM family antitoxin [Anaerolineae bacterium]